MLKPILYKTIKFVYDNLINNPMQALHGCPSENLPSTISSKIVNAQRNML